MRTPSPRATALVELGRDLPAELRAELVRAAYRASRRGRIVLLLRGIESREIDRLLDGVVAAEGCAVAGLRYVRAEEEPDAAELAERSLLTVVSSDALAAELLRRGVAFVDASAGREELERLAGGRIHDSASPT